MLGNTCEHTVKVGNCKHGAPNKVAKADEEFVGMEKLQMHANDDGISVLDACCECGGGNKDTKIDTEGFVPPPIGRSDAENVNIVEG